MYALAEQIAPTINAGEGSARFPFDLLEAKDDASRRVRAWLLDEIDYWGGVWGSAIGGVSAVPILSESEVRYLAGAPDSEFAKYPPIVVLGDYFVLMEAKGQRKHSCAKASARACWGLAQ